MTLKELIDGVDALAPNAYTAAEKTGWVNELAGRIWTEVWLNPAFEAPRYDYSTDQNQALPPVPSAYERLWELWLRSQIDLANGEYDKYANSSTAYNELAGAYIRWFTRAYAPAERPSTEPVRQRYVFPLAAEDWTLEGELYSQDITVAQHSLGLNAYVAAVERQGGGGYQNVWFTYVRGVNGTLTITTQVAFDGRAILTEG